MQEHKVIVAGGRDFADYPRLRAVLFEYAEALGPDIGMSIVSGMARGTDKLAWTFAQTENVLCHEFPADWDNLDVPGAVIKYRPSGAPYNVIAGHMRNRAMAEFADGLVAFWNGHSHGTKHMIDTMLSLGKPVHIVRY